MRIDLMEWQENFHSRFVAWMKIILPVAALGLLSTLFLLSRTVDPTTDIPVAQVDLEQRAQDQGATNPSFAGVATGGEHVQFRAQFVRPDPTRPERLLAEDISADLTMVGGTIIHVTSDKGETDQTMMTAQMEGNVRIITTDGFDIATDHLDAAFDTLTAETTGPVAGNGPPGDLEAGRMRLTSGETPGTMHLVFTEGVKLIYKPREKRE